MDRIIISGVLKDDMDALRLLGHLGLCEPGSKSGRENPVNGSAGWPYEQGRGHGAIRHVLVSVVLPALLRQSWQL